MGLTRSTSCTLLLLLLSTILGSQLCAQASSTSNEISSEQAEGRPIATIVFKRVIDGKLTNATPQSAYIDKIKSMLRTQVGTTLSPADVEDDIRSMVDASAYFSSVEAKYFVDRDAPDASVDVVFACIEPRIADISILALVGSWFQPAGSGTADEVLRILRLGKGDFYSIHVMDEDIRARLAEDERFISIDETRRYEPEGVYVTLRVIPSRVVDRILIAGNDTLSDEDILDVAKLKAISSAGASTKAVVTRDIRESYIDKGYPFVAVTYRTVAMPSREGKAALAEAYPELDDSVIIKLDDDAKPGEVVLVFVIDEGPKVHVGSFVFEGIEDLVDIPGSDALQPGKLPTSYWPLWYGLPFSDRLDRVRRALLSKMPNGPGMFSPQPKFNLANALQDAVFIQDHLRLAGWRDALVTLKQVKYNEDRTRAELVYTIRPGSLYVLTKIALQVTTRPPLTKPDDPPVKAVASHEQIWEALEYGDAKTSQGWQELGLNESFRVYDLNEPGVFAESHLEGDPNDPSERGARRQVEALFGEEGYSNVRFGVQEVNAPPGSTLTGIPKEFQKHAGGIVGTVLVITIDQGYRYKIGEIRIQGNTNTKASVIRRVMRIYPGDIFDIEQMRRAADRLRAKQWYDQSAPAAGVRIVPNFSEPPEAGDAAKLEEEFLRVDLFVHLVEGDTGSFNFTGAFSPGSGVTFSLSLTIRNFDILDFPSFTGAGQQMSLTVEPPVNERQSYVASFSEPYLFGYPLSGSLELSITQQEYDSFTRGEAGGRIGVGYSLYRDFDIIGRYQYFEEEISGVSPKASFRLRSQEGKTRLSAFSVEGIYRTLNRRIFPTGGSLASLQGLLASEYFGGSYNMWRLTAKYQKALMLYEIDESRAVALSLRGAAIWQDAYGDTLDVPLSQKLFLGNIGNPLTLRGFARQGVGPVAGDDRLGGNFVLGATAEVSIEIQPAFFWAVAFLDAGELVPDIANFDPAGVTAAYGVGVRFQLPIFPVPFGVDFGWPLRDQPSNDRQVVAVNLAFGF